ncbi:MAG: hypothetical protein MZV49_07250 [Rhodopseudomonas palustris]|nr:hypothetical protein [Rhodopseudomonas palustris]
MNSSRLGGSSSSIRGRTVTVAACEAEAGKDRVLHLAPEPGTDLVLFNALLDLRRRQGMDRQGVHRGQHSSGRSGERR